MIQGLERFRDYFGAYGDSFVLIGGVAAMQWLEEAGLNPSQIEPSRVLQILSDVFQPA
jgi:hypothetical protein